MRIGFVNGCFDLFHEGHRHFLTGCRRHCDYLIAAVNSDKSVKILKGPNRPKEPWMTRANHVRAFAEAVIPFDGYEEGLLVHIKPDIYFRGYDHSTDISMNSSQVAHGIGCDIIQITYLPGYSTTESLDATE